jgi:hypothetical protein
MPQKLPICFHRATQARNLGGNRNPRRNCTGPFLACPKPYDLCAPNPLSRSASFSDFYLTAAGLWAINYADS